MAQNANVLWIQLENKNRANKYPISDGDNRNLDDLATEFCKKGRLQTLKIDPEDLEFFGDYDKSHYDNSNSSDGPLSSDIKLQHLKTTAKAPLIVRYLLSDMSSKSNYF